MLLIILQSIRLLPTRKNYPAPNANSTKVEKPSSGIYFIVQKIIDQQHHVTIAYSRLGPMLSIMMGLSASAVTTLDSLSIIFMF